MRRLIRYLIRRTALLEIGLRRYRRCTPVGGTIGIKLVEVWGLGFGDRVSVLGVGILIILAKLHILPRKGVKLKR